MLSKRVRDANALQKRSELKAIFKKVVRRVIINSQWLGEGNDENQRISSNYRENIAFVMRRKRKIGMLTAAEKSLIRTPHLTRTVSDRRRLCILFAGLRCFSNIPPIIRARLVPDTKLMTLSKGCTIMRQGDLPLTVFFIVTGEVQMTKIAGSKLSRKIESKGEIRFGPGDCIGDVGLMEDSTRTHTFITLSQCELLVLFDDEYAATLKPYMKKIWDEKKRALKALDYFDFLNEDQILKACKLCTLKQYKPLDTIYSQDRGTLTNVHFVLSGECVILQCLNMKVIKKNGKKVRELVDTMEGSNFNIKSDINIAAVSFHEINQNRKETFRKFNIDTEFVCGTGSRNPISTSNSILFHDSPSYMSYSTFCGEEILFLNEESEVMEHNGSSSLKSYIVPTKQSKLNLMVESQPKNSTTESEMSSSESSSSRSSTSTDYENHFIDVGSLTFGGIFGLGEKIEHRVIMARNTVQCLLLPRFFLLDNEQNPGNIWQRRLFYIECIIPSRETLFDDFLKTLKWKKFKNDFIYQHVRSKSTDIAHNDDIPILCRIEEDM